MSPWVVRTWAFFTHMRRQGWRGVFRMRGVLFDIIGMPRPWQVREPDNDDRRRT